MFPSRPGLEPGSNGLAARRTTPVSRPEHAAGRFGLQPSSPSSQARGVDGGLCGLARRLLMRRPNRTFPRLQLQHAFNRHVSRRMDDRILRRPSSHGYVPLHQLAGAGRRAGRFQVRAESILQPCYAVHPVFTRRQGSLDR